MLCGVSSGSTLFVNAPFLHNCINHVPITAYIEPWESYAPGLVIIHVSFLSFADFFSKLTFSKASFSDTSRVSNSSNFARIGLDPNVFQ